LPLPHPSNSIPNYKLILTSNKNPNLSKEHGRKEREKQREWIGKPEREMLVGILWPMME